MRCETNPEHDPKIIGPGDNKICEGENLIFGSFGILQYVVYSTYDLGINLVEYGTYAGLNEGIVGMRVGETRRIAVLPSSVRDVSWSTHDKLCSSCGHSFNYLFKVFFIYKYIKIIFLFFKNYF